MPSFKNIFSSSKGKKNKVDPKQLKNAQLRAAELSRTNANSNGAKSESNIEGTKERLHPSTHTDFDHENNETSPSSEPLKYTYSPMGDIQAQYEWEENGVKYRSSQKPEWWIQDNHFGTGTNVAPSIKPSSKHKVGSSKTGPARDPSQSRLGPDGRTKDGHRPPESRGTKGGTSKPRHRPDSTMRNQKASEETDSEEDRKVLKDGEDYLARRRHKATATATQNDNRSPGTASSNKQLSERNGSQDLRPRGNTGTLQLLDLSDDVQRRIDALKEDTQIARKAVGGQVRIQNSDENRVDSFKNDKRQDDHPHNDEKRADRPQNERLKGPYLHGQNGGVNLSRSKRVKGNKAKRRQEGEYNLPSDEETEDYPTSDEDGGDSRRDEDDLSGAEGSVSLPIQNQDDSNPKQSVGQSNESGDDDSKSWLEHDEQPHIDKFQQKMLPLPPSETTDEIGDIKKYDTLEQEHPKPSVQDLSVDPLPNSSHTDKNESNTSDNLVLFSKNETSSDYRKTLLKVFDIISKVLPESGNLDKDITPEDVEHIAKKLAEHVAKQQRDLESLANSMNKEVTNLKGMIDRNSKAYKQRAKRSIEEHDKAIQGLKDEMSRASDAAEKKRAAQILDAGKTIGSLELVISQFEQDREKLEHTRRHLEEQLREKDETLKKMEIKHNIEQGRLEDQIEHLQKEKTTLERNQIDLVADHNAKREELREKYEVQLSDLENQFEEDKRSLESKYQTDVRSIKDENEREKRENEHEIKSLENQLAKATQDYAHNLDQERAGYRSQLLALNQEHENRHNRLIEEYEFKMRGLKTEVETMKSRYDAEMEKELKKYKQDRETLKSALVRREHIIKGMEDAELRDNFRVLVNKVQVQAIFEWNFGSTWPFPQIPQTAFKGGSDQVEILKRSVIQSMIWEVLYKRIFYTPFRVLGEEGKRLEAQWKRIFCTPFQQIAEDGAHSAIQDTQGQEHTWPTPSERSEKWRWQKVKECRNAIEKGEPQMKDSYERSLNSTANELLDMLGKVSLVDDRIRTRMHSLAKNAATLWLNMGIQRFRVIVVNTDEGKTSAQSGFSRLGQRVSRELICQPGLRRIGNPRGEDFEREWKDICEGEYINI